MLLSADINSLFDYPGDLTFKQRLVPILLALFIAAATIEFIRRRKLKEEFAILWCLASLVFLVFGLFPKLLWIISSWFGIFYLTTLVLAGFGFLSLVTIHFAMVISRLSDENAKLAQRMVMLDEEISRLGGEKKKEEQ